MRLHHFEIPGLALAILVLVFGVGSASAQTTNPDPQASGQTQPKSSDNTTPEPLDNPKYLLKHIGQDQVAIWSSPFKARITDLKWLVPFAGITTGLIMTDRTASHEASRLSSFNSSTFSDIGLAFAGGSAVGFYLLGKANGNRQLTETGVLGGEAMLNALVVDEVLKYAFQRQRPGEGDGGGRFFQSGSQNAFPSAHATISFAFASVVAHEYNGWLSQTLAYAGASAISLARVTGKQHFPSDIFVGGTIGYLIGRHVYAAHHDTNFDLNDYGTFEKEPHPVAINSAGSTYIELDSWVYPAVERLIALNVIHRPFLGLRPWTRTAVAEMLAEAQPLVEDNPDQSPQVVALYDALKREFASDLHLVEEGSVNQSIRLESVYAGVYPIAGTPLNDSYHFGQTIINNFGRPYWQGFNAVTGFTSRAEDGHFFFYVRGEYQNAPGAPAYPASVRNVILQIDQNCQFNTNPNPPPASPCPQPASPAPSANQFRLLDTYAGFTAIGNEISVGKQSLWWGTGEGGALMLSDNATPFYMLRINRTIPLYIPGISKLLGPLRYDNFFGKLAGNEFPVGPFMYGDKLTFQPTENLELGFSRTTIFGGVGHAPITFGEFGHSFFNFNDVPASEKFSTRDPGARHGGFDFSYKLPYLRKWLTLYSDSIAHDEPNPISAPRRAAIVPGIYLSHFPRLSNLDLRVESGYTDIGAVHLPFQQGGHFLYWEQIFHDAYTNQGNLMGSWIGRDGKGTQVWSNYWLGASSAIQLSYRHAELSPQFINGFLGGVSSPSFLGGGTQSDFSAGARLRVRKDVELLTNLQYERWNVPVLATGQKSDFLTSIQVTFWPKDWLKKKPN